MIKECSKYGLVDHSLSVDGRYRCKKCRYDYVKTRRCKVKQQALDYKGGKCEICSYSKCVRALEFHHLNPNEKEFTISSKWHNKSWDLIKSELDKCILVCSNCNREIHDEN